MKLALDIVLIGVGDASEMRKTNPSLFSELRKQRIGVEITSTVKLLMFILISIPNFFISWIKYYRIQLMR